MNSGSFVYDVNATDDDVMYNGEVRYAMMHGDEGKFAINATSGIITTVGALDRETKDSYTVNTIRIFIANKYFGQFFVLFRDILKWRHEHGYMK